jgi:hypothetical protein
MAGENPTSRKGSEKACPELTEGGHAVLISYSKIFLSGRFGCPNRWGWNVIVVAEDLAAYNQNSGGWK